MKATIDVKDRAEADRVRTALADPETRALVNVLGALLPLSERERKRALTFVADKLAEDRDV